VIDARLFDGFSFHLQIHCGVPVGLGDAGVAEPLADCDDVNAHARPERRQCRLASDVDDLIAHGATQGLASQTLISSLGRDGLSRHGEAHRENAGGRCTSGDSTSGRGFEAQIGNSE
jgi:hypothetical protein